MEDKNAIQSLNSCFHCGLPIAGNIHIQASLGESRKNVCCFGCKAVCELISAGGLQKYYQFRTAYGERKSERGQAEKTDACFDEYDNDHFQKGFCSAINDTINDTIDDTINDTIDDTINDTINGDETLNTTDNNTKECIRARLHIANIHCAACVWLLENACKNLTGVQAIKVNLGEGTAIVDWDNRIGKLSAVVKRISDLGYKVSPWSEKTVHTNHAQQQKYLIRRVGLAGFIMMQVGMFSIGLYAGEFQGMEIEYQRLLQWFAALLTTPVLLYSAQPFFIGAWRSLKNHAVNMDVPVATAITVAYIASVTAILFESGEVYFDSICMFVFLLLGVRYLDLRARNRANANSGSGNLSPLCRVMSDSTASTYKSVPIHRVEPGNIIMVHAGEAIPVDGELLSDFATLNEASINGEFLPVEKKTGSQLLSGALNIANSVTLRVTKRAEHSWLQSVQALAFDAQQAKPKFLQVSDRVARYFSLTVLLATCLTGIVWYFLDPTRAVEICIAMLVISCPCALSLAAPAALTVANNCLREQGALVCDGNLLEQLNGVSRVCFDKTGTLTEGQFSLEETRVFSFNSPDENKKSAAEKYLAIATALEAWSEHPIASAFSQQTEKLKTANSVTQIKHIKNIQNAGVSGMIDDEEYRIGSIEFCRAINHHALPDTKPTMATQLAWLATREKWLACFALTDTLRCDAKKALQALDKFRPILLSGDSSLASQEIARQLGIREWKGQCSPGDKQAFISQLQREGEVVMMVGDGINDLPVLAQADVSIAIHAANDLTKNQADCILLNNDLNCLPLLFSHAKATYKIIRQNITWALGYNFTALPLAAAGMIPPWAAAIGMSASSLIVILNAGRLRRNT